MLLLGKTQKKHLEDLLHVVPDLPLHPQVFLREQVVPRGILEM